MLDPALQFLRSLGHPRILVIGDLMLDRDRWVRGDRIASDSLSIIAHEQRTLNRPGGAALVADALRALDARPALAGVVGDDLEGRLLQDWLSAGEIETLLVVDPSRPTTVKERFLEDHGTNPPRQVLRVDREATHPLAGKVDDRLREQVFGRLDDFDAIVISDYAKGVCSRALVEDLIETARQRACPVIVDPPLTDSFRAYRGCTILTPNRTEAARVAGVPVHTLAEAAELGQRLCEELFLDAAAITLDGDGLSLTTPEGGTEDFPANAAPDPGHARRW